VRVFLVTLLVVGVLAGGAGAQTGWVFLADGELSFAAAGPKDFTDKYSSPGFGAGLGLGAILSKSVMVLVYLNYTYFGIDEAGFRKADELPDDASLQGGDINNIYLFVGARYNLMKDPPLKVKPYLVFGGGAYYIEADPISGSSPTLGSIDAPGGSESVFGVNIGIGADFPIAATVNGFGEVQYQVGFTSDSNTVTIPVRVGLAFLLGQ
jgi:hypothetical protein